jgi:hypothetical protein
MIRKLLLVAAAIAMPMSAGAVTLVATASPAGALPPVINCHDTGTITFAGTSGLTHNGYATTATTSTTAVSTQTYSAGSTACAGSGPALSIKSTNTLCSTAGETTTVPACVGHPTERGYGSFKAYQSGGTSSVKSSVASITFTVNGHTYTSKTCAATTCVKTYVCPKSATYGTEAGFELMGNITTAGTYSGAATTAIVCIGAITGTNLKTQAGATKPGFTYNLLQGETAGSLITVKTATIDKLESSLNIA